MATDRTIHWTTKLPTNPGWYWMRSEKTGVVIADVYKNGKLLCVQYTRCHGERVFGAGALADDTLIGAREWYGPIGVPT